MCKSGQYILQILFVGIFVMTTSNRLVQSQQEGNEIAQSRQEALDNAEEELCPEPLINFEEGNKTKTIDPNELLKKLNFGVAFGVSRLSQPDIVEAVAEKTVEDQKETYTFRVTDSQQYRRELWLETHYLLDYFCVGERPVGHGPFVAANLVGDGGILSSFALGYLLAFKQDNDRNSNSSLNFGIGLQSSSLNVIGDGLEENKPLPPGVTEPRLKKVDDFGVVLMISFTFFAP
jgi:hypothetical protein